MDIKISNHENPYGPSFIKIADFVNIGRHIGTVILIWSKLKCDWLSLCQNQSPFKICFGYGKRFGIVSDNQIYTNIKY